MVQGTRTSAGVGVSSQPNQPIISQYRSNACPVVMRMISAVARFTGAWPERDTSNGLTMTSQPSCATDDAATIPAHSRARLDRARLPSAALLPTPTMARAIRPSHNGPSWRLRASTTPATPVALTRRSSTCSRACQTSTSPQAQNAMAAAISGELGFTVLLTKKTMGVIATARPTATKPGDLSRRSAVIAVARNAAVISVPMKRIAYTLPDPAGSTHDTTPTAA